MAEIQSLIAHATRVATTGERLGLAFARELAKVFRDTERELQRLLAAGTPTVTDAIRITRSIALKAQIREALRQSGYDRLVSAATQTGAEQMTAAVLSRAEVAAITALSADTRVTLEALRQLAALDLFSQGDEVATALWRSVAQQAFTTRPIRDILQDLQDALDAADAEVRTLFDTTVSVFGRQVEALTAKDLPADQPFLYLGPVDDVTRPFCLDRVGKVYTRPAIDAMDNGQLPNVYISGGGYACRHQWIAVESKELRVLADTDTRIDQVESDVQRVKTRKEQKKRKAAS